MSLQGKTLFIWQIKVAKTAKTLVGMTGFGTQKALSYQKPQAKASESRFGTQKAIPYLNPQAKAPESGYAGFGNRQPVFKRKNIPRRKPANYPRILLCRILELLHTAADKTGVSRRKSTPLPYILPTLLKVEFSCFLKSSKSQALRHKHRCSNNYLRLHRAS